MNRIIKHLIIVSLLFVEVNSFAQDKSLIEYDLISNDSSTYEPWKIHLGLGTRFAQRGTFVNPGYYSIMISYFGTSYDLVKSSTVLSINPGISGKYGVKFNAHQLGLIPNLSLGINSKKRTKFPVGLQLTVGYDFHFNLRTKKDKKANGNLFGFSIVIYGLELNFSQTLSKKSRVNNIGISATGGLFHSWKKEKKIKYY